MMTPPASPGPRTAGCAPGSTVYQLPGLDAEKEREGDAPRQFTIPDICKIGLLVKLTGLNLTAERAWPIVNQALGGTFAYILNAKWGRWGKFPFKHTLKILEGRVLVVEEPHAAATATVASMGKHYLFRELQNAPLDGGVYLLDVERAVAGILGNFDHEGEPLTT